MSEINPYRAPQVSDDSLPRQDTMPGSAMLALLSLGIIVFEQGGLLGLQWLNGSPMRSLDVVVAIAAVALLGGLFLRKPRAWFWARAFAWVGIVLLGIVMALTLRSVQAGNSPLWVIPYLILQIGLFAGLYYSLNRATARQYYHVASGEPPQSAGAPDQSGD